MNFISREKGCSLAVSAAHDFSRRLLSQLESRGLNLPLLDMRNGLQLLSMNAVMGEIYR